MNNDRINRISRIVSLDDYRGRTKQRDRDALILPKGKTWMELAMTNRGDIAGVLADLERLGK